MEWYRLPPDRAQRASIRLIGGPLYHGLKLRDWITGRQW